MRLFTPTPMLTLTRVLALALVLALSASVAAASDLVLILDASGSMWGQIGGEAKIVIARRVLGEVLDSLPDDQQIGLLAYGHRREGDCQDIETLQPLVALDRGTLASTIGALNPKGKTPITGSLRQALGLLDGRPAGATLVLVSDGLETCGGDPCALIREAKAKGATFVLHVVGFDVAKEDVSQLECAAQAGGGGFWSADDAAGLSSALGAAVALAPDTPAGALVIEALADGELQDVMVDVSRDGQRVAASRTYGSPTTNPRTIPLPDGTYQVSARAIGLAGDTQRHFEIEITDGATVEKELDFSTGEVAIGVTRNGQLSDALYTLRPAGSSEVASSGRTYRGPSSNPARVRITAGSYDVEIGSVEISGRPRVSLGRITVEPRGHTELRHEFESGELRIGAVRAGELVDATVGIYDGKTEVARGRTYKAPTSNPKTFTVLPGQYRVELSEIRGEKRQFEVTVPAGGEVEKIVDLGQP